MKLASLLSGFILALILIGATYPEQQVRKLHSSEQTIKRLKAERNAFERAFKAQQKGRWKEKRVRLRLEGVVRRLDALARDGIDYPKMIHIASIAYGVDRTMLERRGRCESVNFTDFYNETPIYNGEHAQGAFGFIPSTFASTPYAAFGVLDPLANVFAAAWMHGPARRGGEWACR